MVFGSSIWALFDRTDRVHDRQDLRSGRSVRLGAGADADLGGPKKSPARDRGAGDSGEKSKSAALSRSVSVRKVGERAVGLGHAVGLVAGLHRLTLALGGVVDFVGEPLGHRAALLGAG